MGADQNSPYTGLSLIGHLLCLPTVAGAHILRLDYISAEQIDTKLTELQYKTSRFRQKFPAGCNFAHTLLRSPGLDWEVVARRISLRHGYRPIPPNSHPVVRRYLSAKGEVIVRSDGSMLYSSELESSGGVLTAEEAVAKAEEFLQVTVGRPEGATPDRIEKMGDGTYLVEFSQRWRRRKIETSWIWVTVDAEGILGMEYYWADVVGYSGEKSPPFRNRRLTTIADALPRRHHNQTLLLVVRKPVSTHNGVLISMGYRNQRWDQVLYQCFYRRPWERNFRQENPNKS